MLTTRLYTLLKKPLIMVPVILFTLLPVAWAEDDIQSLETKLKELSRQMQVLQDELAQMKQKESESQETMDYMSDRLDKAELHTATDRVSLGIDLRTRMDSIHYQDVRLAPGIMTDRFFDPFVGQDNLDTMVQMAPMMSSLGVTTDQFMAMMADPTLLQNMLNDPATQSAMQQMMTQMGMSAEQMNDMFQAANQLALDAVSNGGMGFSGATLEQARAMLEMMKANGIVPEADTYDADNDTAFTTKFRLEMDAKVSPELSFMGRMAAYKAWGDSSGVKFNNGSLGDVTLDGNTTSLPHGDTIHLERAFFNYHRYIANVPTNFSLGRRPSTEGPPYEYGNYSLEAGSPLVTIINWQFDGASLNFGLEDMTGVPGAAFKLCYGVGFESGWGNSYSLTSDPDAEDVHLAGFIATLFDDDLTSLTVNYAHAWDITDGFTGLTIMPFIISKDGETGTYSFAPNSGGFITRMEPTTEIGDWDAASVLVRTNLEEVLADIDLFMAVSWSHTHATQLSQNPFYEIMGMGLLSSDGELEDHDGYSVYAGALFPMPFSARLGLEYNWGSKYWFNFTGAEDSLIASKTAARGHVLEAYYLQPVYRHNFFVKLGGQYYDYEYSGSGNPMGAPVKVSEITAFDALTPVIDNVWNAYIQASLRF